MYSKWPPLFGISLHGEAIPLHGKVSKEHFGARFFSQALLGFCNWLTWLSEAGCKCRKEEMIQDDAAYSKNACQKQHELQIA